MSDVVLISDPRIAAIPVSDNGDPLLDLRRHAPFPIDTRLADRAGDFAHVREGVLARLLDAQRLLPRGTTLLIVEGYRSVAQQSAYFEEHAARHRNEHPTWSDEQVRVATSEYVSPPEIAPHSAGAAVDLTLVTADGQELDMGTGVNEVNGGACYTASPVIGQEARENRKLLGDALGAVGLVNYPTEWWHWSFGDRYWAFATGARQAVYGPVERTASDG